MNISVLDWIGYIASLIVLVSLVMSSIVKLRVINLVGATMFAIYGFMIGSLPTGFMNVGIVFVNIYYLVGMYKSKEYFHLLSVEKSSHYFSHFIDFYKEDISKYSKIQDFDTDNKTMSYYVLRNLVTAGIFIATELDPKTLKIELDYAVPEYRDFKVGKYLYETHKELFTKAGYNKLLIEPVSPKQEKYIQRMGFRADTYKGRQVYLKSL